MMASFEDSHLFTLHNLKLKEDEVECKTVIGSGGFAEVFVQNLCIGNSREKKPYAIKRISKDDHRFPRKLYEREIEIFSRLAAQESQVRETLHPISYFPSMKTYLQLWIILVRWILCAVSWAAHRQPLCVYIYGLYETW